MRFKSFKFVGTIFCYCEGENGIFFYINFVYSKSLFSLRRWLCGEIEKLMPRNGGPGANWATLMTNSILEKDGSRPIAPIRLYMFREFFNATNLMDLELKGYRYTWTINSRDGVITK